MLPDGLCKESFFDSQGNCVAVQLAALLKLPLENIERETDFIFNNLTDFGQYDVDGETQSWRTMGVSSKIIAELGMKHGMNVYVLSGGRKIAQFKHDKKGKRACLCYTVDGDHAWFYESESVRRSISHLNMRDASMTKAIAQDFQSTRAEYRTWKEWYNDVTEPGHYDTDDLITARLAYLANTFPPKLRGKTEKLRPCTSPYTNNTSTKNLPLQTPCYVGLRN